MDVTTNKTETGRQPRRRRDPLARLSEVDLVKRAQGLDSEAFEELVGRTEHRLYRLAMRYVHNESDAQEILQNAYLSAWRSLPTFEGRAGFGSWMYRITINAALMFLRVGKRQLEVATDDIDLVGSNEALDQVAQEMRAREKNRHGPDEAFQSAELRERIGLAVNSLPPALKAIFLLREVRELSTEDSAEALGLSVPTVKTRLHRARKVLRVTLGSYLAL